MKRENKEEEEEGEIENRTMMKGIWKKKEEREEVLRTIK